MEHLFNQYDQINSENECEIYGLEWIPSPRNLQTFTMASSRHIQSLVKSVEHLKVYFWFEYSIEISFLDVSNDNITDLAYYTLEQILEWIPSKKLKFYCTL